MDIVKVKIICSNSNCEHNFTGVRQITPKQKSPFTPIVYEIYEPQKDEAMINEYNRCYCSKCGTSNVVEFS